MRQLVEKSGERRNLERSKLRVEFGGVGSKFVKGIRGSERNFKSYL